MNRQQGVTLIELLVALAIVGVIATFAIPAYRGYITTAKQQVIVERVNGLRPFLESARADTGSYPVGSYVSGGTNDFLAIGYRMPGDNDGIKILVSAGACGSVANCYRVMATDADGKVGIYESGPGTFSFP